VGERASDALSSPQFFILAPSSRVNPSGSDLTSHAARACERGLRAGKNSPASTDAGLSMWGVWHLLQLSNSAKRELLARDAHKSGRAWVRASERAKYSPSLHPSTPLARSLARSLGHLTRQS